MTMETQNTIQPINKGEDGYIILDKNDNFFAKTYSSTDANLIAAASDMYQALMALLNDAKRRKYKLADNITEFAYETLKKAALVGLAGCNSASKHKE